MSSESNLEGTAFSKGHVRRTSNISNVSADQLAKDIFTDPAKGRTKPIIPDDSDSERGDVGDINELAGGIFDMKEGCIAAVNRRLLPYLFIMLFFCYINEIAPAYTYLEENFKTSLGLNDHQYGIGVGMYYLSYALGITVPLMLAFPRHKLQYRIAVAVGGMGIVSACFTLIGSPTTFIILRVLMGIMGSMVAPSVWDYMSQFYPRSHITVKYILLEVSQITAQLLAIPLAAVLLGLNGVASLYGWQWLFLLEGLPAFTVGVFAYVALPVNPGTATFLTQNQQTWLQDQVDSDMMEDRNMRDEQKIRIVLLNRRLWVLSIIQFLKCLAWSALVYWTPRLIKVWIVDYNNGDIGDDSQPGSPKIVALCLTAIPYVLGAIVLLTRTRQSKMKVEKGSQVGVPLVLSGVCLVLLPIALSLNPSLGFFVLGLVFVFYYAGHVLMTSMVFSNISGSATEVALAFNHSIGNLGSLIGPILIGTSGIDVNELKYLTIVLVIFGAGLCVAGVMACFVPKPELQTLDYDMVTSMGDIAQFRSSELVSLKEKANSVQISEHEHSI